MVYTIYTQPRQFLKDAKLHSYLAHKRPDLISRDAIVYTLQLVLTALKQVISHEKLFDPNNVSVIIGDVELERALGMKSLHVTEVRDVVILQMEPLSDQAVMTPAPERPLHLQQTDQNGARFDVTGRYYIKPNFLRVLRMVEGVDQTKVVFEYKEITKYLSQYILVNKERFFDDRNIKIAHVENDPLGVAFNVKAFHRSQVTHFLRKQLTPAAQNEIQPVAGTTIVVQRALIPQTQNWPGRHLQSRKRFVTGTTPWHRKGIEEDALNIAMDDSDAFEVEYEPEGATTDEDSSKKDSKRRKRGSSSSSDSEIDDIIIDIEMREEDATYDSSDDLADDSDSDDDDFTKHDVENTDYWKCMECKVPNTPYIRYCSVCYKERKGWLPARPKPKKKRDPKNKKSHGCNIKKTMSKVEESSAAAAVKDGIRNLGLSSSSSTAVIESSLFESCTTSEEPCSSQDSGFSEPVARPVESSDEEGTLSQQVKQRFPTSSSSSEGLCTLCFSQPKNACLVHGRISHQVCCYGCAKKLFKNRRGCPVCRRRIEKITKNIVL